MGFILFLYLVTCFSVPANCLSVSAKAAVLLCADTGEVLFEKNAHEKLSMASTTKIMTSLLLMEEGTPGKSVRVTEQMTAVEGTSMGLLPGDSVSYYALCVGMLLSSGNDAANTAAIAMTGSAEKFAERMNARAAEIGMTDTHFVTPSGLDDDAHYSTAYDMALLGATAIRNPQFLSVCSQKSIAVSYGNPPYRRTLSNHNRLLRLFDSCIGIKTGFTKKSGRCLVSAAMQDGVTLVAVTLSDPDDWNDHIAMFRYGFSAVSSTKLDADVSSLSVPVTGGTKSSVSLCLAEEPTAVLPSTANVRRVIYRKPFLYAPVEADTIVGKVVYLQNGRTVCETTLLTSDSISMRPISKTEVPTKKESFTEKIKGVLSKWHR